MHIIEEQAVKFLGIDIGASSIKHGAVYLGKTISLENFGTIVIPQTERTENYSAALKSILKQHAPYQAAGLGFPSVIYDGIIIRDDVAFHSIWLELKDILGQEGIPCFALNDADASGIAEVYREEAENLRKGATIVLTLGTGIGSAIFIDGRLLANTELGLVEMNGEAAEEFTAPSIKTRDALSLEEWARRFQGYLEHIELLLAPDHIVLGGGISADFEEYKHLLKTRASLQAAYYRNQSGVVGAAIYAARQSQQYSFGQF